MPGGLGRNSNHKSIIFYKKGRGKGKCCLLCLGVSANVMLFLGIEDM